MPSLGPRRLAPLAALALAVSAGFAGCGGQQAPGPPVRQGGPNVVVIETDDQTVEQLRVMANVKRLLADRGTTFDNSLASLPQCCPSRATFLTGQYAHNHHVQDNREPYGGYYKLANSNTLAVWLQRSGYYTALIGKYLNRYGKRDPEEVPPGWTYWFASLGGTKYYGYEINDNGKIVKFATRPADYSTDVIARAATALIRRRASSRQPFFLWLTAHAPHDLHGEDSPDFSGGRGPVPARRHAGRFRSAPLPRSPAYRESDLSDKPGFVRRLPRIDVASVTTSYRRSLESLLAVDEAVGAMVQTLRQTGKLDNTYILFTSDNGFFYGEHRIQAGKLLPYEPSIRVPLIIRGPGIPQRQHRRQQVANIDLAPTILAATHVRPGRLIDGISLLPLAQDPQREAGRDILIESPRAFKKKNKAVTFSGVRTPRYKYVEYTDGQRELYDLRRDPWELRNVAGRRTYARVRAALTIKLRRLRTCRGASCRSTVSTPR